MLRIALKISLLIAVLAPISYAQGEVNFQESRTWRRAKVINPGQQVWSFLSSYQSSSSQFAANGQVESLGTRHARAITWGQLINAEKSPEAQAELKDYMKSQRRNENDIAATSTYRLEREDIGFGVDWAYGLTKRWMIGFQVPVFLRTTSVASSIAMTPTLARGAGQDSQKSTLGMSAKQMNAHVKELAEKELSNSGYDSVPEQKQSWEWGDVSLLSQFYLSEGRNYRWAFQQMVRVPTSRNPSVTDFLQRQSDDGQLDIGLTSLVDYRIRKWTLGLRTGYIAQLPDSAKMRVPDQGTLKKTPVDPKVHRDLGDWVWASVDSDYRVGRRVGLEVEHSYLNKSKDKYKGESLNGTGYASLGENTNQELHQTRVGVLYDLFASTSRRYGVAETTKLASDLPSCWEIRNQSAAEKTMNILNISIGSADLGMQKSQALREQPMNWDKYTYLQTEHKKLQDLKTCVEKTY